MSHQAHAKSGEHNFIVQLSDPAGHQWQVDEPVSKGGGDTAPNPMQVLLSALGACTTVTLQMYAQHKGWDVQHIQVDLVLDADGEPKPGSARTIKREVHIEGAVSDEQKARLLKVAESCPVHKLLVGEITIETLLNVN